jgi:50S ribosomal protein L16 3-hydroxylase
MAGSDRRRLLGGRTPAAFLARHWHKEPLIVRAAVADLSATLWREALFDLASSDDVGYRVVRRDARRYSLAHGPFTRAELRKLPASNWTLLVQGVNLHDDGADALLRRFAFIPYARLDDVMVSYATPGGGVGPHFDSYDVFLLQTQGQRRWRYGRQRDLSLRANLPLRILRRFAPEHDATLAPGDMLYLPPEYAHDGTAVDACITYSIGFRAPRNQELAEAFVDHLRDALDVPGRYADPDLRPSAAPARIDARLARRMGKAIAHVRWSERDVRRFIGRFLTEPKPEVVFTPLGESRAAVRQRMRRAGVRLDRRTQLLYDDARYYLNGDDAPLPRTDRRALRRLADRRSLSPAECAALAPETLDLLCEWHRHGLVAIP